MKFVEFVGGDLIIIYNSGCFCMVGCGFLVGFMFYGNVNDIMFEMVSIILIFFYFIYLFFL